MKKVLSLTALLLLLGTCSLPTLAADSAEVYVTIADENGNLAVAQESVTVTDTDGDGAITINDALYAAHVAYYAGGADGYASEETDFGVSMTKLWGVETSGCGYYVNNASAWSLTDPVQDGDRISAFIYTDTVGWSDTYCFLDAPYCLSPSGGSYTLTLLAATYDENYNPITVPVENAVITVNGQATAYRTDADGNVTITLDQPGTYVVSATSDSQILVPPVCRITVEGTAPQTGDTAVLVTAAIAAFALAGAAAAKKKVYEK